jgi:predicted dehydrogenase
MPDWKKTRETGGGVLLDLASHHFDLIRFWFDQEIVEIHANVRSQRSEDDTATVQLRLAGGLLVESFFSLSSVEDERFEVYGTKGKLSFDRFNSWNIDLTDLRMRSIPERYFRRAISSIPHTRFVLNKLRAPGSEPSFSGALRKFVIAAQTGRQIHPDLNDGLKSLAVVLAAEESARRGAPVAIPKEAI